MKKQLLATLKCAAILSLVLGFVLSVAEARTRFFSDTMTVRKGQNTARTVIAEYAQGNVALKVRRGALDAYMTEQGINQVTITYDLLMETHRDGDRVIIDISYVVCSAALL